MTRYRPQNKKMPRVTRSMLAQASAVTGNVNRYHEFFAPAVPPPGVLPKGERALAFDASPDLTNWAFSQFSQQDASYYLGYAFLGYPVLAEMSLVPEYRLICDIISTEMTRKWIKIKSTKVVGDDFGELDEDDAGAMGGLGEAVWGAAKKQIQEEQQDRVRELEHELARLNAQAVFKQAAEHDSMFGRGHIYIDTGDNEGKRGSELTKPIGTGDEFTQKKFKKGFLKALRNIEPMWVYPARYNADDPLKDDWFKPSQWYVMGKEVHESRLLTFVGRPVPDMLKARFAFGGLSLMQMAKPVVDNWLKTRESVGNLIQAFSQMVLKTDLSTMLAAEQGDLGDLDNRAKLFNMLRNNLSLMIVNKDSEELENVSVPLSSLPELQAQSQEHICSISRIPLVKFTGLSPTGLNASSEGEIQSFYDTIRAMQEWFFRPRLDVIFRMAQINIWGAVDEDLTYDFEPLMEMTAEQLAQIQERKAATHRTYVDMGAIDPGEVRQALSTDEDSEYDSLDPDDVPDLPEADEEALAGALNLEGAADAKGKAKGTGAKGRSS